VTFRVCFGFLSAIVLLSAQPDFDREYRRRVDTVRKTSGFVALWDFVKRDSTAAEGRFDAYQPAGSTRDFRLDAINYVLDYWQQGRKAEYADIPLLGRGPFGQAIEIRAETDPNFRPLLMVPRTRLHDSGLDVKGPGRSVSMVVWLVRTSGNHAISGIWHEGTDLHSSTAPVARVEPGMRQYALFAGLAANNGAAAVHVSENGASSFSDKYARNLATTPELIPIAADIDKAWTAVGFTFDNAKYIATAYINGVATEYWIDKPQEHPFFRWAHKGWQQAHLHQIPGLQPGEEPDFPTNQFYTPPESRPLSRKIVEQDGTRRVEIRTYAFTKVRVTLTKDASGKYRETGIPELVALKVNPFYFPHDLYAPASIERGGPFTIGRVIHTSRSVGFTGYIGGVAVFSKPLPPARMRQLAAIGRTGLLRAPR
jgi:hypothetical protein